MAQTTPNNNPMLKDAREAKGLTLEIVHEATKIPLDALKAIEQGYSVRILTPFYYRGFIKIYAEFLGLDVDEVFKSYNIKKPETLVIPAMEKKAPVRNAGLPRRPQAPKQPRLPGANPVLEKLQESVKGALAPKSLQLLLRAVGIIIVLFALVKIGGCVASHLKVKPSAKAPVQQRVPAAAEESVAPPPAEMVKAQSSDHKVRLAVRAMKSSWIQVKADGKVVFAMTMQKGTMESWSARDRIELSGKNINELELEVNGRNLGPLGSRERRAKRVLITRDGLTVKR